MKILIACEYSGRVRDAFLAKGHDVMSCDILPTESPGPHYQGNVFDIIQDGWDMMIAHPPCTYLTVAANKYFVNNPERWRNRLDAMLFVHKLLNCGIKKICLENPKGVISSHIRKADQYIQPWWFGHPETKMTGFWLKNLPKLIKTNDVEAEMKLLPAKERGRCHHAAPGPNRWKVRSTTLQGVADAMADQWG